MGLENRDSLQPEQPAESEHQSDAGSSEANSPAVGSSPATTPPSILLPNMTSQPPTDALGTAADAVAQYPSLDAAVEIEQQAAPTLTNLLATAPQIATPLDLGLKTPAQPVGQIGNQTPASQVADSQVTDSQVTDSQAVATTAQKAEQQTVDQSIAEPTEQHLTSNDGEAETAVVQQAPDSPAKQSPNLATSAPATESDAKTEDETAESEATKASESENAAEEAESEASTSGDSAETAEQDFDQISAEAPGHNQQVLIKREDNHVAVLFPKEERNANPEVALDFTDSQLWQDLQQRLSGGTAFAKDSPVHLYSQNHLLDTRQLQELDEALGRFNLKLVRIITSRRQTAVAAAMSGYSTDQTKDLPELLSKEVHSPQKIGLAEPLYLQKTIRSGTEIRHPGSVIIMGDLNPGSSVIADGDILIWGRLRGIAHAGAAGQKTSIVMALKLEAPQLRIAGAVARVAAQDKATLNPEIAYISDQGIRITSAYGFNRGELG